MSCSVVASPCPPLQRGDIHSSHLAQAVPLSLPRGTGARAGWVQKGSSASQKCLLLRLCLLRDVQLLQRSRGSGGRCLRMPRSSDLLFFLLPVMLLAGTNTEQELVAQVCWCIWEKKFSLSGTRF